MFRPTVAVALACAAAAGLPACDGDETETSPPASQPAQERLADDRRAVTEVLQSYLSALAAGDGERACGLLTPAAQREVVAAAAQPEADSCQNAIAKASTALDEADKEILRKVEVTDVAVQGDAATATAVGAQRDISLVRTGGEWRIAQLAPPGDASRQADASLPSDGCRLLSARRVEALLGGRAQGRPDGGDTREDAPYVECVWETRRNGLVAGKLTLALVASAEHFQKVADDPDAEPVTGVGDAAVAFTGGPDFDLAEGDDFGPKGINTERVIVVRAGDRTLLLEWNLIAAHDREDLERRLPNRRLAAVAREVIRGL